MNKSIKYIVIGIFVLLVVTISVSYSYFLPNFINNTKDNEFSTGNLEISIDDEEINAVEISPIYDEDYELLGIHKRFNIISTSSLNSCGNLYINVSEISDELKSEYFKYKLLYDDKVIDGNFKNANSNEKMLILDNLFLESKEEKTFDLYIWVSYQEDVDQLYMLNGKIKSNLYVEAIDSKSNSCGKQKSVDR